MSIKNAWESVRNEATRLKPLHLRELFTTDADRFNKLSFSCDDLTIDFSREKLDTQALGALLDLARTCDVEAKRDALFSGQKWNNTENRAVLHMALRGGAKAPEADDVAATRDRFLAYAERVRNDGKFDDVINIGIGGSDLGPAMATRALAPDHDGPRLHFVSNVDGAHLTDTLKHLDAARTLVIVASKTFTTLETMRNALSARDWLGIHTPTNMAAVSTNITGCAKFGIPEERVFGFWDWVGGRYSIWSAIGLPLAIAIGAERFSAFLDGAAAMDRHFRETPLGRNLPVLLALTGIWRRNAMEWPTAAMVPYDQRLERFAAYVQQLDMESNGKQTDRDGKPVNLATAPVIWGEPGTNAQHSFFQLIHQGTDIVPVDFIVAAEPREKMGDHHAILLANCLAQSQALAFGKTETEVRAGMSADSKPQGEIDRLAPHRTFPGDRPSTTILFRKLDPYSLGRLVALYEHKVFVQGIIWNINSFDQWGVELGKQLASSLIPVLKGEDRTDAMDVSTAGLIDRIQKLRVSR